MLSTPNLTGQSTQEMELQEKKRRKIYGKTDSKEPKGERRLVTLDLELHRSYIERKHSPGKYFPGLAV